MSIWPIFGTQNWPKFWKFTKISATFTPFQNLKWGNRFLVGHMNSLTFQLKFRNVSRHLERWSTYRAMTHTTCELMWICSLLHELKVYCKK